VQANAVRRDVGAGPVDGLDMERHRLLEALEGIVLEEPCPLHREVRAVELEHVAAPVDQLVFLLELIGQGHDVALVGVVVSVEENGGGGAGGHRGHEALGEGLGRRRHRAVEHVALPLGLAEVLVPHRADRLGRVADARGVGAAPREQGRVVRELGELFRRGPPARAPEAAHAPRHVGREPGARLLAVVADVDARFELTPHDVPNRRLRLPHERSLVHRLAAVLLHEQRTEREGTGNAADVGGEDALVTCSHDPSGRARVSDRIGLR
jgi:hypothetical protein